MAPCRTHIAPGRLCGSSWRSSDANSSWGSLRSTQALPFLATRALTGHRSAQRKLGPSRAKWRPASGEPLVLPTGRSVNRLIPPSVPPHVRVQQIEGQGPPLDDRVAGIFEQLLRRVTQSTLPETQAHPAGI